MNSKVSARLNAVVERAQCSGLVISGSFLFRTDDCVFPLPAFSLLPFLPSFLPLPSFTTTIVAFRTPRQLITALTLASSRALSHRQISSPLLLLLSLSNFLWKRLWDSGFPRLATATFTQRWKKKFALQSSGWSIHNNLGI